jgi:hypothetical protein
LRARRDKPSELREEQKLMQRKMEETTSERIDGNFIFCLGYRNLETFWLLKKLQITDDSYSVRQREVAEEKR